MSLLPLITLAAGTFALDTPTETVTYDAVLSVDPETEQLTGRATLDGLTEPIELSFAERFAFARVEPRLAGNLEVDADAGATLERLDPFRWRLVPGDERSVELKWSVKLDHRSVPDVVASFDGYEFPYVTTDHGMLATAAVLPAPSLESIDATLRFELPDGWDVIAPWVEREPGTFLPTADGLRNDLVAIGAWERIDGSAAGLDYTIAVAPSESHVTELARETIPNIVELEVERFGGAPQPRYLFLFGSSNGVPGMGGSPKTGAMTLFVDRSLPKPMVREGIAHLVAHEYHHTWMNARCRPHDELRHVIEGFTDYAAYAVIQDLGVVDARRYGEILEGKLAKAEGAAAKFEGSLCDAGGPAFFAGGAAYDSCYAGGLAMALWLDVALRRADGAIGDVDALLRALYNDPRWKDGTRPSLDDFVALIEAALGEELAERYRRAVTGRDPIDFVALFASIDVPLERSQKPLPPSPRANFDGTTVGAIDPAGAGAAIGLRAGDIVVEVNGEAVEDQRQIRASWNTLVDGELRVAWTREGERMDYAGDPPSAPAYALDPAALAAIIE